MRKKACARRGNYQSPPLQRGSWFEIKQGARSKPGQVAALDEPWHYQSVLIPSLWAIFQLHNKNRKRTKPRRVIREEFSPSPVAQPTIPSGDDSPASLLDKLPTELLDHVFTLLVPTGIVLHTSPTQYGKKDLKCVHTMCTRTSEGLLLDNFRVLSLINKRMKDMTYDIFYGRNQFVFEIAARPLLSRVKVQELAECAIPRNHNPTAEWDGSLESWARLVTPDKTAPMLTAPFGMTAMSHMRNAVLHIVLTPTSVKPLCTEAEWKHLSKIVSEFVQATSHKSLSPPALQVLTVNVAVAKWRGGRGYPLSDRLVVTGDEPLNAKFDNDGGSQALELKIQRRAEIEDMLSPLRSLRGLRDVCIGGLVHEAFAARLEGCLTKSVDEITPQKRTQELDGDDGEGHRRKRPNVGLSEEQY